MGKAVHVLLSLDAMRTNQVLGKKTNVYGGDNGHNIPPKVKEKLWIIVVLETIKWGMKLYSNYTTTSTAHNATRSAPPRHPTSTTNIDWCPLRTRAPGPHLSHCNSIHAWSLSWLYWWCPNYTSWRWSDHIIRTARFCSIKNRNKFLIRHLWGDALACLVHFLNHIPCAGLTCYWRCCPWGISLG